MKQELLTVLKNKKLNINTFEMHLEGASDMPAGQFVELKISDNYLRRPFSVANYESGMLTILYKVVGRGTEQMTKIRVGEKIDALTQLGNTFNLERGDKPILLGGGIGAAPLYGLARAFNKRGITPTAILGFRNADELFYIDEFSEVANVIIATDNGSAGFKGNAVNAFKQTERGDFYYACGPMIMLKAISDYSKNGQISLEARMGCGFGACMGCSIKTLSGYKRVCKEGPVFDAAEVIYE